MNIWVPLVLAVMPMSIGLGSFLFVAAILSTISLASLYVTRPRADLVLVPRRRGSVVGLNARRIDS